MENIRVCENSSVACARADNSWRTFETKDDVDTKTVEGGLYAVMTCKVEGAVDIGKTWGRLIKWIQKSEKYDFHPNWKGLNLITVRTILSMESQDWKIILILGLKLHPKECHGNPKKNSS